MIRFPLLRALLVGLLFVCQVAVSVAIPLQAGPYRLEVGTEPRVIPVGRATIVVRVTDSSGKPVEGAEVRAIASMPGMKMGEKEEKGRPGEQPGEYRIPAAFSMAGLYEARFTVVGPAGEGRGLLELTTGQDTASTGGFNWKVLAGWVALIALVIVVVVRMRKTGQRLDATSLLKPAVWGSLVLLAGAIVFSMWLVKTQRRPGAMTPIEAQAMEMNTPAPEGVLPVVLAKAERKSFVARVRFSGQAMGFTEQDVVPRTTGVIVDMPVYVGDRVQKGQVLARLDTSQLDPEVAMREAALARSQQGVGVAAIEYQAALSEVAMAQAEAKMAQGEQREAQAMLEAATEGRESAIADVRIAEAEILSARAELESATSARTYAQAEVARQQSLAEQGYVSRREAERARAEADRAEADVRQAEQSLRKAEATVAAAKAAQRRVDAEIVAARVRVDNTKTNALAKEAAVRTAQRGAEAAKARVSQERTSVAESQAGLRGAATQKGYAVLRAEADGVIMQRTIAPGQVVSPGQPILRLATTSPIRLQANVPEGDLARIQVGDGVVVTVRGSDAPALRLRVTSVAPSVDTGARMGTVEALYENKDDRFRPGQYLSMAIELGKARETLVVPSSAIVRRTVAGRDEVYVWVAEGEGTDLTLTRRSVGVSDESDDLSAIDEGLTEGERVVVDPGPDLRPGIPVVEAEADTENDDGLTVRVTDRGYEPPTLTIPANKAIKVTFIRKTEATCGEEIIIPDLQVNRPLPLNVPVTIEIPARPPGRLRFTCAMDMLEGTVVVR